MRRWQQGQLGMSTENKSGVHTTDGEVDPGNLQSRWVPCEEAHGPPQGQLPKGSLRPRGISLSCREAQSANTNIGRLLVIAPVALSANFILLLSISLDPNLPAATVTRR